MVDDSRSSDGAGAVADFSALPKVGEIVGGLYRLVRLLGEGNFGRVYVAQRVDVPEHQVALKIMLRAMYTGRDVERELVMLAAASHPHMVQLKDHGMSADYVWFTMPVYEGETLSQRLQRGTLSLQEAYDYFVPLAHSLAALHNAGLRHQDLKPENIFLADFAGRIHPIILDLGVAAEKSAKFIAGTLLFASPEQTAALVNHDDDAQLTEKIDTYGLAATLLLSLVGMELFPGSHAGTHNEMLQAQRLRVTNPLDDDALPTLQGRARQMLSKAFCRWFCEDPVERPTMEQMAEQLEVLLEQRREQQQLEERKRSQQRMKLLQARVGFFALVAVAIGVVVFAYTQRETWILANQLQQAREKEAVSYDSLQTCQGAQQLTLSELTECKRERSANQQEYQKSLLQVSRARDEISASSAACVANLRACEDEANNAAAMALLERDKLISDNETRFLSMQTSLQAERDEQSKLAQDRAAMLEVWERTTNKCITDLAQCRAGRSVRVAGDDNPYADGATKNVPSQRVSPGAAAGEDKPSGAVSEGVPVQEQTPTWD